MTIALASATDNPYLKRDAQNNVIQSSSADMAYQADFNATTLPVYVGYARPGTATSGTGWQIRKHTNGANGITATQWPQGPNNKASSEYNFIWDNRATYTYS